MYNRLKQLTQFETNKTTTHNALRDTQITAARETSFKLAFCRKSIRCRQLLYSTAKDVSLPNLSINSSVYN